MMSVPIKRPAFATSKYTLYTVWAGLAWLLTHVGRRPKPCPSAAPHVAGQPLGLEGVVRDAAATGDLLSSVTIRPPNSALGAVSDLNGVFRIERRAAGPAGSGRHLPRLSGSVVARRGVVAGQCVRVGLVMQPAALAAGEVVVTVSALAGDQTWRPRASAW
ncbi:MAG: hypothetical protein IPM81_12925 [Saprospirales bacterium]|nr:hypothetical protein [Saprospirales bacterium]